MSNITVADKAADQIKADWMALTPEQQERRITENFALFEREISKEEICEIVDKINRMYKADE